MGTYLVEYATVHKTRALLRVERRSYEPSSVGASWFAAEHDPAIRVKHVGSRPTYDENNQLTNRVIFIVELPNFPIADLVGKTLVPLFDNC